jgi:hypothetical protein
MQQLGKRNLLLYQSTKIGEQPKTSKESLPPPSLLFFSTFLFTKIVEYMFKCCSAKSNMEG